MPMKTIADVEAMTPQQLQDPVAISAKGINQMMAPYAIHTQSIKEFGPESEFNAKQFWLQGWSDINQKIAWNIATAKADAYHVVFLVSCAKGKQITVTGPSNSFVFTAPDEGWQRSKADGILHLTAGTSVISLQLPDTNNGVVDIKSIELINVLDEDGLAQRIAAYQTEGDTSWMKTAGYGIMVQGGEWSYPPHGDKKPWPGFAHDFDAKAFVDKIDDMGGKYLVWSATWSSFYFPAPIKAILDILPDRVSQRDLIGDLISECHERNIRFMLYYHLGHSDAEKRVLVTKGWKDAPKQDIVARQKWLATEQNIFREIGLRYGSGLDAVFIDDGCCWYPADFEALGTSLKAGNPKRIICYNPWIACSLTPFQDFYCGEQFNGSNTPWPIKDGVATSGPQKGLQMFGNFIFDGPDWGIKDPNVVIDLPQDWTSDTIVELTKKLEEEHYSVAINLLMYEDGSVGQASYDMLKQAAQKLHRGKWASSQTVNAQG